MYGGVAVLLHTFFALRVVVSVPWKGQYTPGLTKTTSRESHFYTPSIFMVNRRKCLAFLEAGHEENRGSNLIGNQYNIHVRWSTVLQAGRSRVRFQMKSMDFFSWPNPSSRTMALESTQPLIEMSTGKLPMDKGWPASKADRLTAICELIV
jgi:hypothetical protein